MNVFPTALIRHVVNSNGQLEIWVRYNKDVDGDEDSLGAWIDPHGALIVQTNSNPFWVRQIFLPNEAWAALEQRPWAELVLCGMEDVVTTRDFQLGVIVA